MGNYEGGRGQKFWNITGIYDAYFSFLWTSRLLLFPIECFEVLQKPLKGKESVPKCSKYKER